MNAVVSPATPLLSVQSLVKTFAVRGGPPRRAVDGVSFDVRRGETLGIVGESGCGKSTVARLVARLLEPDAGEVRYEGEAVGQFRGIALRTYRRRLQLVFQDSQASLNPRLPIVDSVAFGPRMHGLSAGDARAHARSLLERVGLPPARFAHVLPHALSGGQRQRVNIARALALEPRAVVLDEAVAALDKSVQAQVLNLLRKLKDEDGLTYLFISHDLDVVRWLSDSVLVMYLGRVVEHGPVEAVYERPRHPYTRALLASAPSLDPDRRTERAALTGEVPAAPSAHGCAFRDRCPHALPRCSDETPQPRVVEAGHLVACHLELA